MKAPEPYHKGDVVTPRIRQRIAADTFLRATPQGRDILKRYTAYSPLGSNPMVDHAAALEEAVAILEGQR